MTIFFLLVVPAYLRYLKAGLLYQFPKSHYQEWPRFSYTPLLRCAETVFIERNKCLFEVRVIDETERWSLSVVGTWKIQAASNLWPLRCQCNALPTELWSHTVGNRSICWAHVFPHLSGQFVTIVPYRHLKNSCGSNGIRTLYDNGVMLYQLDFEPTHLRAGQSPLSELSAVFPHKRG